MKLAEQNLNGPSELLVFSVFLGCRVALASLALVLGGMVVERGPQHTWNVFLRHGFGLYGIVTSVGLGAFAGLAASPLSLALLRRADLPACHRFLVVGITASLFVGKSVWSARRLRLVDANELLLATCVLLGVAFWMGLAEALFPRPSPERPLTA